MLVMLSCYNLFLKEVSRKKLRRLAELAHRDPNPLEKAIRFGFFKSIKREAIELLEGEKKKAKYINTKQQFQAVIDMLADDE